MKTIYELTWTGNIKKPEVLSCTPLPNGQECYDIKNFGYLVLGKKRHTVKAGTSVLCFGLTALIAALGSAKNVRAEYLKEQIERYNQEIAKYKAELEVIEKSDASWVAFVEKEKLATIETYKSQGNVPTE